MSQPEFADAALVLLGHGTTLDTNSSAPVYQHAAELRRRHCFAAVRETFWKQPPQLTEVLSELQYPRIFIVPLFISEGHFSETVIPLTLGFSRVQPGQFNRVQHRRTGVLVYCRPLGTHPAMTELLQARATEVLEQFPFPRRPKPQDVTLFIAGHGTEQNTNSREAVDRQVAALRDLNLYAAVHAVFLDEEPRISACCQIAQTPNIVVIPFFISEGLHVRQDIPVLLGQPEAVVQQRLQNGQAPWRNPSQKHGKLVWYGRSVGTQSRIAELILERVREGATWLPKSEGRTRGV